MMPARERDGIAASATMLYLQVLLIACMTDAPVPPRGRGW
jgi:hypothetical protein